MLKINPEIQFGNMENSGMSTSRTCHIDQMKLLQISQISKYQKTFIPNI